MMDWLITRARQLHCRLDRQRGYGAPATFHYIKSYEAWMTLHHLTSWAWQVGDESLTE